MSLAVSGPLGLCTELTEQTARRLVHLVNYPPNVPVEDLKVRLQLPEGRRATSLSLANPERDRDLDATLQENTKLIEFTVPSVGVYEMAVVELER